MDKRQRGGGGGCPHAHTHNGMLINPVKKIQTHYPHGWTFEDIMLNEVRQ